MSRRRILARSCPWRRCWRGCGTVGRRRCNPWWSLTRRTRVVPLESCFQRTRRKVAFEAVCESPSARGRRIVFLDEACYDNDNDLQESFQHTACCHISKLGSEYLAVQCLLYLQQSTHRAESPATQLANTYSAENDCKKSRHVQYNAHSARSPREQTPIHA